MRASKTMKRELKIHTSEKTIFEEVDDLISGEIKLSDTKTITSKE